MTPEDATAQETFGLPTMTNELQTATYESQTTSNGPCTTMFTSRSTATTTTAAVAATATTEGTSTTTTERISITASPITNGQQTSPITAYNSEYLLPYSQETDRYKVMHYMFKNILDKNYKTPLDRSMQSCLDIGSGNGIWIKEMADEFPHCQFYGIDLEPLIPDSECPMNCHLQKANILDGIPFPDESFDYVHTRMMLLYLPAVKLRFVLDEIARVTKRSGWVEFLEAEVRTENEGPILKSLIGELHAIERDRGLDASHMMRLEGMLVERGLVNTVSSRYPIPMGNWAGTIGVCCLTATKLYFRNIARDFCDHTGMPLESLLKDVETLTQECELYKPFIKAYLVYGQKL